MKLYNQLLMEHYHNPRNYKVLANPDYVSTSFNPLCGDKIFLEVKIVDAIISEIGYRGEGCIISVATASLLFDTIENKAISFVSVLRERDILDLIKLELGPNRLKCALLPLEALKNMIDTLPKLLG